MNISLATQANVRRKFDPQYLQTRDQHTIGHIDCPACRETEIAMMFPEMDTAEMGFIEAAEAWMQWRSPYRKIGTMNNYRSHVAALKVFFGGLRLNQITAGHLREYQMQRLANKDQQWNNQPGPSYINHELNTLTQILKVAGLWKKLQMFYMPLDLPRVEPRRVMSEEEEEHLFNVISGNDNCFLAYLVASISNNTTATGVELRSLRLKDVHIDGEMPEIDIPPQMTKNGARARRIPLNETAQKQFVRAIRRAMYLGSVDPDHYVFPYRVRTNVYDPTRPASASWLRKQWEELRRVSGLDWLRPHDLRHQAVTRMLETGVDEETAKAVAGHISKDILKRYSHVRHKAKHAAVSALEPSRFKEAHLGKRPAASAPHHVSAPMNKKAVSAFR